MRKLNEIHPTLITDIRLSEEDVLLIDGDNLTDAGELYLQDRIDNEADWLTEKFAFPSHVKVDNTDSYCMVIKWYAENHGRYCSLAKNHDGDHDFGEDD